MRRSILISVGAGLLAVSCTEAGDVPALNDFLNAAPSPEAAASTSGGSTTPTTGTPANTPGGPATTAGDVSATTGTPTNGETTGQTGDATGAVSEAGATGTPVGTSGDAGTDGAVTPDPEPAPSVIEGTYVNCSSYTAAAGNSCSGYYCSVTAADLAAELQPGTGPCSNLEPDRVCGGRLTQLTGACARSTKSNPLNAFDTDAQLRVKIRECIYEDPDFDEQTVPVECTECFLDAAQCASDFCLTTCLAGDSPECDACRLENDCNQPVPTCGGLPSPF